MTEKSSAQNVIQSYRKRQQMGPFIIGGLAVVMVIVGIVILLVWMTGPNSPSVAFLTSPTPTSTDTPTPTATTPAPTSTATPTETVTPTITETATRAGPQQYTVQEGDICWNLAEKFEVDLFVLIAINNWDAGTCPIHPGDTIWIPTSEQQLDTPTPVPTNFRGDISYIVQPGDMLADIAFRYYSTVDAILKKNKITDANKINAGDTLIIPANIATHVPTRAPTSTLAPPTLGTQAATATTEPAATATP